MPLEEFCKELVFSAIYNYHKNRRRIKVEKDKKVTPFGTGAKVDCPKEFEEFKAKHAVTAEFTKSSKD